MSGAKERPPWVDFVAGGAGGCAAALVTCPLEVIKTRLQSSFYKTKTTSRGGSIPSALAAIVREEGFASLWRGIGPNLFGVLPSRSIYFGVYANVKKTLVDRLGQENSYVHMASAATAGFCTTTISCPIWVVKTRIQLQSSIQERQGGRPMYTSGFHCFKSIIRDEGVGALYRGLAVSYFGIAEGTMQFIMYERAKQVLKEERQGAPLSSLELFGLAGTSKMIASLLTYPHEVVRTRQRQASNSPYKSFVQSLILIGRQEGRLGLYGGLTPHLLRTVPNSAIMFLTYELVISVLMDNHLM